MTGWVRLLLVLAGIALLPYLFRAGAIWLIRRIARVALQNAVEDADAELTRKLLRSKVVKPFPVERQYRIAENGELCRILASYPPLSLLFVPKPPGTPLLTYAALLADADTVAVIADAWGAPDQTDAFGQTALIVACWRGDADVARALLERGASPGLVDASGRNARDWAAVEGHAAVVALLDAAGH